MWDVGHSGNWGSPQPGLNSHESARIRRGVCPPAGVLPHPSSPSTPKHNHTPHTALLPPHPMSHPDAFLTQDVFTRLAWAQFSLQPANLAKLLKEIDTLITTTKLNTHTLVHTLFYLDTLLHSSATALITPQRSTTELYELLVVLMMVANKANDDSSYTLKTWDNLTPLNTPQLKQRELLVLKSIKYNVFLKEDAYLSFCTKLHTRAITHGLILVDLCSPPHSQQLQPVQLQMPVLSMPPLGATAQPSPFFDTINYPLTPRSPVMDMYPLVPMTSVPLVYTVPLAPIPAPQAHYNAAPHTQKRRMNIDDDCMAPMKKTRFDTPPQASYSVQVPMMPMGAMTQFNAWNLLTPVKAENHENCQCCCLTNMTNVYHSSLKVSKL